MLLNSLSEMFKIFIDDKQTEKRKERILDSFGVFVKPEKVTKWNW